MFKKLLLTTVLFQLGFVVSTSAQTQGCPEVLDQQQTTLNNGTYGADQWQSFMAGTTGFLTKVEFMTNGFSSGTQNYTFSIYAGQGTTGTLLYNGAGSFNTPGAAFFPMTIPSGAVMVSAGNTYTCRIQISTGYTQMASNSGNGYASGTYFSDVYGLQNNWDICFKTYIAGTVYPTATATAGGATTFCQGGSVVLNGNTGGGITYQWENGGSPIGGATTQNYTATSSGSYTLRVTNTGTGCWNTSTPPIGVTVDPLPTISLSPVHVSCFGGSNGSINSSVGSGTPGYTYSWAPSGGTGSVATNLAAGNYTLTVVDSKGCIAGQTTTVNQPAAISTSSTQSNVSCNGGANGTASVTPTGGTPSYTFSWAPSGGTGGLATGLVAGSYTCTVTDANGCVATEVVTITQPAALAGSTTQNNVLCNGAATGTASVTPTGGTPAYTYSWAPSGGTGGLATGLAAGNYTCTVTDANACVMIKTFTITQPAAISSSASQTNITCNGLTNGSATVTPTGGTPGYSYSWSPSGATTPTATGLATGNHTCTITDANGCTNMKLVTITEPSALTATSSHSDVSCFAGNNGSVSVSASGGTPSYTYLWLPGGATTPTATNLTAGSYTCTVTDANGCTTSQTETVAEPTALSVSASQTNVSCFGGNDGTASVSVSGGTASYSYVWSPGGATTSSATNLTAGSYTCNVTDANGCTASNTVTVGEPTALSVSSTQTDVGCNGASTGIANVFVSGGTPVYSYSWSPAGGTAATASALVAGTYTCTITDANACVITQTVSINEPTALSSSNSQTNVSCNAGADGSATVAISGGTPSYSYSWSPAGGTAATATGLTAGTYTCTTTDANACVDVQIFTITEPTALTVSATGTNVSCNGGSDGTATATETGGVPGYSYSWSPAGGNAATATGLTAGSYTCTVTDANGCSNFASLTITEPTALSASTSQTDVDCNGNTNGTATITASGGTASYTYAWTSGGTAATETGLAAGSYTCTTTDANGCSTVSAVTITEPTPLVATFTSTDVSCNGGADGSATATVTGGTGAYAYIWTPAVGTTATVSALIAGTYSCTITDINGCTTNGSSIVAEPLVLSLSVSTTDADCNGAANGTATVTETGGTAPYTYAWTSGGNAAAETGLAAGTYTCTVTDANGCSANIIATINQPTSLSATVTQTDVSCNGGTNGDATVTVSGGTPSYTYAWVPSGGTGATETGLAAGVYTVTITDANGCSIMQTATITEPAVLATSSTVNNVSCNGTADGSATVNVTGGTTPYNYSWSPITNTTATASLLSPGTYTCSVTDANGCAATETVTINSPGGLSISISTVPTVCGANYGSATATVSGGVGPYIYQWSSGSITTQADSLVAGQYLFQVYDANNCYASMVTQISANNGPSASPLITNVSCNGGSNGAINANISGGTTPYTYTWSTGATTSSLSGLAAGIYDLEVDDANGCSVVTAITVTEPSAISFAFAASDANCGLSDGSVTATVSGGTGAYNYQWSANAGSQTTATANAIAAGVYTLTVTDAASCTATGVAIVNSLGSTIAVSVTGVTPNDCGATSNGAVTTTSSGGVAPVTYLWSNGATTANISGVPTGTYFVTVTDANNCSASASATVNSSVATNYQPEICIVTVDTSTYTNYVIWEKPIMSGISAYKVYRETSTQNVYMHIGTVPFDSLSQYEDLDVADPQVKSWRYKISAVDSCGVETGLSTSHKTIHLTQAEGTGGAIDLAWDFYSGFNYVEFFVWRHDSTTGWMLIDSLPSTQYTYTDAAPPSANSVYMIEVEQQSSCNPTRAIINTSRSNVKGQIAAGGNTIGIASVENTLLFGAYPNPTSDELNVHMKNGKNERMTLRVYDAIGQLVYEKNFEASSVNEVISMRNFASGLYLLELRASGSVKQMKIIKK